MDDIGMMISLFLTDKQYVPGQLRRVVSLRWGLRLDKICCSETRLGHMSYSLKSLTGVI